MKRIALIGLLLAGAAQAQTTGQSTSWRNGDRMAGTVGSSPQGQAIIPKVTMTDASGNPVSGTPTGTAGNPNSNVVTVQGIANGVPQAVAGDVAAGAANSGNPLQNGGVTGLATNYGGPGTRAPQAMTNWGAAFTSITGPMSGLADNLNNLTMSVQARNSDQTTGSLLTQNSYWDGSTSYLARGDANGARSVNIPVATAAAGAAYTATQGATSVVLKGSAGNLYAINLVNSTAAGFVIAYNGTAAPASGTALTAANASYCYQVAASTTLDKVFPVPMVLTTGITLLLSTSCTTFTPVGTAPILFSGQVK